MSKEKWDKYTVAKCVYYICVHTNSKEFFDEVYKYQEQDRLSEIPTQIMNLYKQLQASKEENEKLTKNASGYLYQKRVNQCIDLEVKIQNLTQQNKQLEEENEKLKECFIPLNMNKYYCSKEVYDILEDTKNEWQMVSQLESERVMEIVKLERENKDLTQQNKQMRETLKNMSNQCERNFQCVKNGKGCIMYTYRNDCYKFNAQQALKGE